MSPRFVRLLYRAHDSAAAHAFYEAVLGPESLEIVPVPPAAAARGAPAHWLGVVGVDDVAETLRTLVARGATALGPILREPDASFVTLRDAGGALLALSTGAETAMRPAAVWCHLDAHDAARTFAGYAALFGWRATTPLNLGPAGQLVQFAYREGGANVGSYMDLAARPGLHPQWSFHFPVAALDPAVEAVTAHGGVVLADVTPPGGARVVVCDDPQGAGFALRSDLTDAI